MDGRGQQLETHTCFSAELCICVWRPKGKANGENQVLNQTAQSQCLLYAGSHLVKV